jgi:MoaA/NifB/PqqE/SkfB family radical SAM enzyme
MKLITVEKLEMLYSTKENKTLNNFENHNNYNCTITTDLDCQYRVYANSLHNQQLDHWKGWQCNAGFTRLHIDKNGDVYSGECRNDFLGNVFDGTFEINKQPTICQRSRCTGCTDDLIVKKQKPSI